MYTGMKTQPSINRTNKAFNSNPATAMPEFAALPLNPGNKTKFYVDFILYELECILELIYMFVSENYH